MAQTPQIGTGIGLTVMGLLLTIAGAAIWSSCSGQPTINGVSPNCGGLAAFVAIGIILLIIGIIIVVMAASSGPRTIYPSTDPAVPPPVIQPVVVQQTIVQQTVEVRCRYCGSLNPVTANKCAACGAAL